MNNLNQTMGILCLVFFFVFHHPCCAEDKVPNRKPVTKVIERIGKDLSSEVSFDVRLVTEIYVESLEIEEQAEETDEIIKSEEGEAEKAEEVKGANEAQEKEETKATEENEKTEQAQKTEGMKEAAESAETEVEEVVEAEQTEAEDVPQTPPPKPGWQKIEKAFQIHFSDAPLLKGEREKIVITFDGYKSRLYIYSDYYNYQIEKYTGNTRTSYDLIGTRKPIQVKNTLKVVPRVEKGLIVLKVEDTAFDPEYSGRSRRFIVGTIRHTHYSGFLFLRRRPSYKFEIELSSDKAETDIKHLVLLIPDDRKIHVSYQLKVRGSEFFSQELSQPRTVNMTLEVPSEEESEKKSDNN